MRWTLPAPISILRGPNLTRNLAAAEFGASLVSSACTKELGAVNRIFKRLLWLSIQLYLALNRRPAKISTYTLITSYVYIIVRHFLRGSNHES